LTDLLAGLAANSIGSFVKTFLAQNDDMSKHSRLMKARRFNAVPQILELQSKTPGIKLSTGPAPWQASAKMCGLARIRVGSKTGNHRRPGSRRPVLQKRASVLLALTTPANPRKLSDLWPTAPGTGGLLEST
jgi:hypothetical protein